MLSKTDKLLAEIRKQGMEMNIRTSCPVYAATKICVNSRNFELAYEIYECMEIERRDSFGDTFHAGLLLLMDECMQMEDGLPEAVRAFNRIMNMGRQIDVSTAEAFLDRIVARHDEDTIVKFFQYNACPMTDSLLMRGADALILSNKMDVFAEAFDRFVRALPIRDEWSYYMEEHRICAVLAAAARAIARLTMGTRTFLYSEKNLDSMRLMEQSVDVLIDSLVKDGHRIEKYSACRMFETLHSLCATGTYYEERSDTMAFAHLPAYEYVAGDRYHMISTYEPSIQSKNPDVENLVINDLTTSLAELPHAEPEKPLIFLAKCFPEESAVDADLLENTGIGVFEWLQNRPEGAVEWEYAKRVDSRDMDDSDCEDDYTGVEEYEEDEGDFVDVEYRDDFDDGDDFTGNAGVDLTTPGRQNGSTFIEKFRRLPTKFPKSLIRKESDDDDEYDELDDDDSYYEFEFEDEMDFLFEEEPRLRAFNRKMLQLGHISRALIPHMDFDIKDVGYAIDQDAQRKSKMRRTRRNVWPNTATSKSITFSSAFFHEFDVPEEDDGRLSVYHCTGKQCEKPYGDDETS
jgi:hypothetical protein